MEVQFNDDPLPKQRIPNAKEWFAALDRLQSELFMSPAKKARN
jgi:DNA-binding helix-hairpin-helix protein with protein kinase domain